jgi:predicted XRE-type DNA-binding protein
MRSGAENKPTHIVKGNIFDALGFSTSEASALKIKAEILSAILEDVRTKGYTQAQLAEILDEYQPSVSSLLRGRISQVSIEKTAALCRPSAPPDKHCSASNGRPQARRTEPSEIERAGRSAKAGSSSLAAPRFTAHPGIYTTMRSG